MASHGLFAIGLALSSETGAEAPSLPSEDHAQQGQENSSNLVY